MSSNKLTAPPEADNSKATVKPEQLASEYLANERTFLAWVRTGIAVISLGFVVAKFFGRSMEKLPSNSPEIATLPTGSSSPAGIGMMLFGGLLVALAALRYRAVDSQIKQGEVSADRRLVALITVLVVILSLGMAAYLMRATA